MSVSLPDGAVIAVALVGSVTLDPQLWWVERDVEHLKSAVRKEDFCG